MIFTLYRKDGSFRSIESYSKEPPPELFERLGVIARPGKRPDTYLDANGHVRQLKEFAPSVTEGSIARLPAGAQIAREGEVIARTEKPGGVKFAGQYAEPVELELRHPAYRPLTVQIVPATGAAADGAIVLKQDRDALRAAAYPPLADLADAIVKGDDAALAEYREACLAVKARFPKP